MGKAKTYGLLIMAAAFWGFQPSCIKWLLGVWSPETLTACRYFCMSLVLIFWAYERQGRASLPDRYNLPWLLSMGILGISCNNILQFTGLEYTSVTNCTLISAASPMIAAVMAFFILRERLGRLACLGILISLVGVLTVVSQGSLAVLRQLAFNWGDVLCFLSQVTWTIYSLLSAKVMKRLDPVAATGWAGFFGAGTTMLYGQVTGTFQSSLLPFPLVAAFFYTVFCGGVLAMVGWNMGVKHAGVSVSSVFLNLMPVVGMLAGSAFFGEQIGPRQILGALTIAVGVWLTVNDRYLLSLLSGQKNSYDRYKELADKR